LEKKRFSAPSDADEHLLLLEQQITKRQYEAYHTSNKQREDESVEEFLWMFDNLAPWEQEAVYRSCAAKEDP
jgi:hypothetical protein